MSPCRMRDPRGHQKDTSEMSNEPVSFLLCTQLPLLFYALLQVSPDVRLQSYEGQLSGTAALYRKEMPVAQCILTPQWLYPLLGKWWAPRSPTQISS